MKKHHQICLLAVGLLLTLTAGCNNEPARPTVNFFHVETNQGDTPTGSVIIGYGIGYAGTSESHLRSPATSKCVSETVVGRPLPKSCGPLK